VQNLKIKQQKNMRKNQVTKSTILFLAVILILSTGGCVIKIKKEPEAKDSGIFKSIDGGETWVHKVAVPTVSGTPASIATIDIDEIVPDPQDNNALYLQSPSGLYYSYNASEIWLKASNLPGTPVTAMSVDPNDKCTLFAAVQNKIYKTVDCSRSWEPMHLEERTSHIITYLAIDYDNSDIIYAGENFGDVLRSVDGGLNWAPLERFQNAVKKILVDPNNINVIYVATAAQGIYKTTDRGNTWENLKENMEREFPGSLVYRDLEFIPSLTNALIYANEHGILITVNGGQTWDALTLLSPPRQIVIYAVAVDPSNEKIIYYSTATAFYKSVDGGKTWTSKKLISTKSAFALHIDPLNTKIIYMGIKNIP